ncbi:MAG TPA: DUF1302 family protein [Candidatus Binatia bacterium]|nr:DUF1302 family protein [Candidatus Binatia bacterium]
MERSGRVSVYWVGALFLVLLVARAEAASILGGEWEKFFTERVRFGGYIENVTGLAVGPHNPHFNVSNRFQMNRFTIQPEFNIDIHDKAKLFISWKFVKEPRYNDEARARRITVSPKPVPPLENTFYDEKSFKPWEAVLTLSPLDVLSLRFGRQFISWGETDGLRILDVINPQDTRFSPPVAPNLFDLDDTRIPSWGMRVLYTMNPVNNSILDFFALPGFDDAKRRVDDIVGSNDTADGIVRYGRWSAHPETRLPASAGGIGRLYANPVGVVPVVIPSVTRRLPDAGDSWKIGARFTHNIGGLNLGLGYIWGFNPQGADMVFKVRSVSCPGAPCLAPTTALIDLVNDRTHLFAAHFNYTVGEIASIPFNTAVRGELAFYPDKPYNISIYPGPTGLKAGPHPKHPNGIVEKHTIRYSLGFDRTALIPFLQDDPLRAFRFSLQLFQSIILDHEDGIHPFSTAEKIGQVSTAFTFRVSTGYLGDTILPDLFLAYDPDGYWVANPAVTYAPPWSEKIKIGLIGAFYGGRNKFKSFGFFDEKDSVFLKMRYQF